MDTKKKLKLIFKNRDKLNDIELNYLDRILLNHPDFVHNVDETTKQYRMALKFINKILRHNDLPEIEHLFDFKNVKREALIKFERENKMLDKKDCKIYKYFDKVEMGFYVRKQTPMFIFRFLNKMLGKLGLKLNGKVKYVQKNNNTVTLTVYSII